MPHDPPGHGAVCFNRRVAQGDSRRVAARRCQGPGAWPSARSRPPQDSREEFPEGRILRGDAGGHQVAEVTDLPEDLVGRFHDLPRSDQRELVAQRIQIAGRERLVGRPSRVLRRASIASDHMETRIHLREGGHERRVRLPTRVLAERFALTAPAKPVGEKGRAHADPRAHQRVHRPQPVHGRTLSRHRGALRVSVSCDVSREVYVSRWGSHRWDRASAGGLKCRSCLSQRSSSALLSTGRPSECRPDERRRP